jgi:hypothetical protein
LAARPGHHPIGVTKDAIELAAAALQSDTRLPFYRVDPDPNAIFA